MIFEPYRRWLFAARTVKLIVPIIWTMLGVERERLKRRGRKVGAERRAGGRKQDRGLEDLANWDAGKSLGRELLEERGSDWGYE